MFYTVGLFSVFVFRVLSVVISFTLCRFAVMKVLQTVAFILDVVLFSFQLHFYFMCYIHLVNSLLTHTHTHTYTNTHTDAPIQELVVAFLCI